MGKREVKLKMLKTVYIFIIWNPIAKENLDDLEITTKLVEVKKYLNF
jgi:hypothetical protein